MKIRKMMSCIAFAAASLLAAEAPSIAVQAADEAAAPETSTAATDSEEAAKEEPKVGDHIKVNSSETDYWDINGRFKATIRGDMLVYIIDRYDADHWRVYMPELNEPERVIVLDDSYDIEVLDHDGYILGDLCRDNVIDSYDLCLLRAAVLDEFSDLDDYSDIPKLLERSRIRIFADVNSDEVLSVADLVCMSNLLLGKQDEFVSPETRTPFKVPAGL